MEDLRATLVFAGQTLVEYQARQAAEAGAGHISIHVGAITPSLTRSVDRLLADGINVSLVRSPADVAGTKLRTPSRTGAWIIEALGAAPAAMPVPELPQALSKKVVDGALIPWEIIPPLKLQDQTQYQIEGADRTRFGTITFQVSMNKDRWDSLPPDIQQAFRDASGPEWWGEVGDIWVASDETGIKVATDAGNEHVVLTEEETGAFREALEPVVARWIEEVNGQGIDGAALVDKARSLIEKHASN